MEHGYISIQRQYDANTTYQTGIVLLPRSFLCSLGDVNQLSPSDLYWSFYGEVLSNTWGYGYNNKNYSTSLRYYFSQEHGTSCQFHDDIARLTEHSPPRYAYKFFLIINNRTHIAYNLQNNLIILRSMYRQYIKSTGSIEILFTTSPTTKLYTILFF